MKSFTLNTRLNLASIFMSSITLLGLFAAACTTIAYLPQAIKTVRSKHTKDISLLMYVILVTGIFAWFIYGMVIKDIPLMLANGVSFLITGWILILKIRYR